MNSKNLDGLKRHKIGKEKNRGTRDEFEIMSMIVADLPHLRKRVLEQLEAAKLRFEKQQTRSKAAARQDEKDEKNK